MANESPLKMMKMLFIFSLVALFVLKIYNFLSGNFGHVEKRLNYKDKVNFKVLTVQPGKQRIAIHILLNISRSHDNQRMKLI